VTGIFVRQVELAAKRVEIAREAFPSVTVVGNRFLTGLRARQGEAASRRGPQASASVGAAVNPWMPCWSASAAGCGR